MKIYGHPWSINTRKLLMTVAEKAGNVELALVMLPKGEHKGPEHIARHPFGKVPVLDDAGFVLYETRAISRYLDRTLPGPKLTPADARAAARADQWTAVADAYFTPHAHGLIVEAIFRRYLGGEQNVPLMKAAREAMPAALDVLDRWLSSNAHLAGESFSLADIEWMPYLEYLVRAGESVVISDRRHVNEWWQRISARPTWHKVARTGPQPDEPGMTADAVEALYRR